MISRCFTRVILCIQASAFVVTVALTPAHRSESNLSNKRGVPQTRSFADDRKSLPREKFGKLDVAGREVLVKLERCDSGDSKAFLLKLTKEIQKAINDPEAKVSQVVNDCWFSVKSSNLNVATLMERFTLAKTSQLQMGSADLPPIIDTEPNFVIKLEPQPKNLLGSACPNNDLFQQDKLWGLNNSKNPQIDVDAVQAWKISKGSPEIAVGVIDSGIVYDHPDLAENVWEAPEAFEVKVGSETIPCKARTHGYNALGETDEDKCNPMDGKGTRAHGTLVSGIIGAVGGNNKGVVGVNWYTSLIGLRFIGASGGEVADAARAIEFAMQLREEFGARANIRVLNASWGYRDEDGVPQDQSDLLRDTIRRAGRTGILFVASAGQNKGSDNDAIPHYPSSFDLPNLVSVTAMDQAGLLASMSGNHANVGATSVHLTAPGKGIYSTYNLNYCYYKSSGTSMAAPFVSGAAALILSVPDCSSLLARELKEAILRGVVPTRAPIPTVSRGMLNVHRSILRCRS